MNRSSGPRFLTLLVMISIPRLLCSPALRAQTSSQLGPTHANDTKQGIQKALTDSNK